MVMPSKPEIHPVLLKVLAEWKGAARPNEVVAEVTKQFSQLTPQDLSAKQKDGKANLWRNRVHWARMDLVNLGHVDNSIRGEWRLTPEGIQAAHDLGKGGEEPPKGGSGPPLADPPKPPIRVVSDLHDAAIAELRSAATDSGNPDRLEHAVAQAMDIFGFDVAQVGGPGQTDVVVSANLGPQRYRCVIDAKSTATGRVSENQINWLAIDGHRKRERADYAVVVGGEFAGGQLRRHAEDFAVCLLKVEDLCDLVGLHATQPMTLVELRELFAASPEASQALPGIKLGAHRRARRRALTRFLLELIARFNESAPDAVMANPQVLWGAVMTSTNDAIKGATIEEVHAGLQMLELIGVLARFDEDSYVAQTSTAGALQMLATMAREGPGAAEELKGRGSLGSDRLRTV